MLKHNENPHNCNWITLFHGLYWDTQGFKINKRMIVLRIREFWSRVFCAEKYLWKLSKSVFVIGKIWQLLNAIIVIMYIVILRWPDVLKWDMSLIYLFKEIPLLSVNNPMMSCDLFYANMNNLRLSQSLMHCFLKRQS